MSRICKKDFIHMVYEKIKEEYPWHEVNYTDVYWTVKAVFKCLPDIIKNGDSLQIYEYFTLTPKLKKKRMNSNFGNPCETPEHYTVKFNPKARLLEACAELYERETKEENGEEECLDE